MKEASYFKKLKGKVVQCTLCPWNCKLKSGMIGKCGARINIKGVLYSIVYGEPNGFQIDPVEKKPFFHFHPGSKVLSFGTNGCNLNCDYCCNYFLSQSRQEVNQDIRVKPEEVVNKALINDCDGIAFTYNEPTIFFEYAFDIMKLAHSKGLFNVFVTNGCINKEPVLDLDPYLDAVVINFKGFNQEFYTKHVNAKLEWVKNAVRFYSGINAHKEVTYLVVAGLTDSPEEIASFSRFIIKTLGPDTPVHFLRFFPLYKMVDVPQTPIGLLNDCRIIAKREGLNYVYLGNVNSEYESTYCPYCGELLIKRSNGLIIDSKIVNNECPVCKKRIPIKGVIKKNFNHYPYFS